MSTTTREQRQFLVSLAKDMGPGNPLVLAENAPDCPSCGQHTRVWWDNALMQRFVENALCEHCQWALRKLKA